jgi:hypothetical protein
MTEKLSENFTLEELIYSDTAKARGIDNSPTALHKKILKHTCEYLLEPLRKYLNDKYKEYNGKKVKKVILKITSGYRSATLNTAVGGVPTSQHSKGEAADLEAIVIYTNNVRAVLPYNVLYEDIKAAVRAKIISVDQCIQERTFDKVKKVWIYWIHISHHNAGKMRDRREFWKYDNGMYMLDTRIN